MHNMPVGMRGSNDQELMPSKEAFKALPQQVHTVAGSHRDEFVLVH